METKQKVDTEKRPWHTPELRKNTVRSGTQFGLALPADGHAQGSFGYSGNYS